MNYLEGMEAKEELYDIEKEILVLRKYLSAIPFVRLSHILRDDVLSTPILFLYLQIIYTYSEDVPGLRDWIIKEFKDVLVKGFSETSIENDLIVTKINIESINTLLGNELNQFVYIPKCGRDLATTFTKAFSGDPEVESLIEMSEFRKFMDIPFQFTNILEIDDQIIRIFIQEILVAGLSEDLVIMLVASNEEVREKIFNNTSRIIQIQLRSDIEGKSPVSANEMAIAEGKVIAVITRLLNENEGANLPSNSLYSDGK
ncbi:MAG: FliG C-terminal domain-containing protein [Candidatus Gracilibacteria bacterium]|nr:FliG C-terminal domain-containing protein [Candidatus Gracilibacteria bacterium]